MYTFVYYACAVYIHAYEHHTDKEPMNSLNLLILYSWPMTSSCNVGRFLLATCQYAYLQVYISTSKHIADSALSFS